MAFEGVFITLAWLVDFQLPSRTMRLCDGGQVIWGADTYRSADTEFGTIGTAEETEERIADETPSDGLTFLPASTTAAATLSSPAYQMSPVRLWLAEVDPATGEVTGTPELVADRMLDTTTLRVGKGYRRLDMGLITVAERLFNINEGNVLSPTFHKSVWPGELGFDNATGVPLTVAWGVKGPPRGSVSVGGGGGGGTLGGFGGVQHRLVASV
jgi:hypothetical protein